jgi:SP family myo-inositol transporter-like MFS transporter 13
MSLGKEEKNWSMYPRIIEHVEPLDYVKDQSNLSSIEATAASKTAWLIPIVVTIGGPLFGMLSMQP